MRIILAALAIHVSRIIVYRLRPSIVYRHGAGNSSEVALVIFQVLFDLRREMVRLFGLPPAVISQLTFAVSPTHSRYQLRPFDVGPASFKAFHLSHNC